MKLKDHFKFAVKDAKQLAIALMGAYGMWAATGFQRTWSGLMYPIMGFVTGGMASRNSSYSPNVLPDSHIQTPYANNINDGSKEIPTLVNPETEYKPEGTDVKKVIQINSGIIK